MTFHSERIKNKITDTPLAQQFLSTEEKRKLAAERHPLQRYGKPEDCSNLAVFLLGNESSRITGQIFHVDGGGVIDSIIEFAGHGCYRHYRSPKISSPDFSLAHNIHDTLLNLKHYFISPHERRCPGRIIDCQVKG